MKLPAVLSLVLMCTACNQPTKEEALKASIDSLHRLYQSARQELLLKKDSAKAADMYKDALFLQRLSAAENRAAALKQELGAHRKELRALRKEKAPAGTSTDSLTY